MTDKPSLIERLENEADLCRNEGAQDIADLIDEAVLAQARAERDAASKLADSRLVSLRYVFEQLSIIQPDDDDNRPIEKVARNVVAKYQAAEQYAQGLEGVLRRIKSIFLPGGPWTFLHEIIDAALAKNSSPAGRIASDDTGPVGLGPRTILVAVELANLLEE